MLKWFLKGRDCVALLVFSFIVSVSGLTVDRHLAPVFNATVDWKSAVNDSNSCQLINTVPRKDQCQYAIDNCYEEDCGTIDYVIDYYCYESAPKERLLLVLTGLLLVVLFTTLGMTASDFLCPNLNSISKLLHLSENVTGLTLLAFGNGSPDLFSTYSSMKVGAGSLAIGELVGAALFITSVVVGSMSVVHPFRVIKKIFIRDILYFLVCLIIADYFILVKHGFSIIDCAVLIGLYLVYVVMIVIWQFASSRIKARKRRELKARNQYFDDLEYSIVTNNDINRSADNQNDTSTSVNSENVYFSSESETNSDAYEDARVSTINDLISNSSVNLNQNPFLDDFSSSDGLTRDQRSIKTSESRALGSLSNKGYLTYNDIQFPGEVAIRDHVHYNVHAENIDYPLDENDQDEDDDGTLMSNRYFVRPSLLSALELNQNIHDVSNASIRANKSPLGYDDANDRISLHTVEDSGRILYENNNRKRPQSEPITKPPNSSLKLGSKSAPAYTTPNTDEPGEAQNEETRLELPSDSEYESTTVQNEWDEEDQEDVLSHEEGPRHRKSKFKRALRLLPFYKLYENRSPLLVSEGLSSVSSKLKQVFLPSLVDFGSKPFLDKVLTIAVLPLALLLRCTVPVVEYSKLMRIKKLNKELKNLMLMKDATSDEDTVAFEIDAVADNYTFDNDQYAASQNESNVAIQTNKFFRKHFYDKQAIKDLADERLLLTIQGSSSIILLPSFIFANQLSFYYFGLPVSILLAIIVPLTVRSWFSPLPYTGTANLKGAATYLRKQYVIHALFSIIGFAMSIAWICEIAEEVVAVLEFYSVVFGLSDAILGFTVFAIGNSLGDFIANFTIAKMGFPRMALAACFGGPLLNILTGIGVSGLVTIPILSLDDLQFYRIEPDTTLWISSVALILNLVFLIVVVPKNDWKMDRSIGYINVCFWLFAALVNVMIELL